MAFLPKTPAEYALGLDFYAAHKNIGTYVK